MPLEDTPNFLQENTESQPFKWIEDAGFDLHKSKLPSMDQVRAMTNAALDAAATSQPEAHTTIDTPDVFAPQPLPVEIIDFRQLSEKELSARIEGFRQDLLEGKTQDDFRLAA